MSKYLLHLVAASTVLSAAFLGLLVWQGAAAQRKADQVVNDAALSRHWQARAFRWEARADTLYREAREADLASARYAELMVQAEGRLDQCRAYQF